MKKLIVFAAACLVLFSCSRNKDTGIIGKWKLTEELMDIGDGKGVFKEATSQQTIEFFRDGTFTSTFSLCLMASGNSGQGAGTYSMDGNKMTPENCAGEGRSITFELSGQELILDFSCIEPCRQKYIRVN